MPDLLDKRSGKLVPFDDKDVAAAVSSGSFSLPDDKSAVAVHRFGEDTFVAPELAKQEATYNPTVDPSQAAIQRGAHIREDRNSGALGVAKSAIGGGVSGLTVGLVNPFEEAQEFHPWVSGAFQLGGALAGGEVLGVGKLGAAIREGGGLGRAVAAGAAEGGIYGAGNAVSELARSDDPLTAEHVASVLSSNILLGGAIGGVAGVGTHFLDRGLQIAGDRLRGATGARDAMTTLPEDLQGLDDAGLKAAHAAAKTEHTADIAAERASLEEVRVNQRAEVANNVKALHEELATERPIFSALSQNDELTPELKGIEGVADARVAMAKSYKALRSAFDNPLNIERNPWKLVPALEQRQGALEALQQKLPEMHAALAGDARAAVLEHVDTALAETRDQIAHINSLDSRANPVASGRLSALEAGPSARMQAIEAARDALKNAPELGLIGKGAKGAAFGGVTALAHMIPGVGFAAPFVGKAASDAVEKFFTRASGAVGKVGEKASGAAQKFLTATKELEHYVAPVATKVLASVKFGASKAEVPEGDLAVLHRQRTSELYQHTMRMPDGTTVMRPEARAAMAAKLDPIRQVNPLLADKIETVKARATAYLASIAPKKPEPPGLQIGPDTSRPSDMAIRAWARAVRAVEDPSSVEERLARGLCTPEEANCYRTVYPERFAALQREIFQAAPQLEKTLPMNKKVALSIFTGIPVTPAMQPNVIAVLQATFDVEPGSAGGTQAPRPQPNYGAIGSLKDIDKPTHSQERQQP